MELNDLNKEDIIKSIKEKCLKYNIEYIIVLAKKGAALFEWICEDDYLYIPEENRYVKVYVDRAITKRDNYEFLNDKNIMLFDDTMKSGFHFSSIADHLTKKISLSLQNSTKRDVKSQFYYYCVVQCANENDFIKNNKDRIFSYFPNPLSYRDYFDFCLMEASAFQKDMTGNSIDLPIFEMYIDKIENFKNIVTSHHKGIIYNERKSHIGNYQFNVGSIFIDDTPLLELLKGFLIAATAKVRYEYIDCLDKYKIKITPFALTGSIKIDELKNLYSLLFHDSSFDKDSNNLNDMDASLVYIKLYRYVNFLISFYIGDYLSNFFSMNYLDLTYTNNGIDNFGIKYNEFIKDIFIYKNYNIYERLNGFKYSQQIKKSNANDQTKILTYDDINEYVFEHIIAQNIRNISEPAKYNLLSLKEIANIFESSKNNLITFCSVLINNIESFSVTNEIFLQSKKNQESIVIRGFLPGEISVTALPYDGRLFFKGLYAFYKKVNKNYEDFLQDYDLFIEKFYNLLMSKNIFETDYISFRSFHFFEKYFKNLEKSNFIECIEAKRYLLEYTQDITEFEIIDNLLAVYLTSMDFKINQGKV